MQRPAFLTASLRLRTSGLKECSRLSRQHEEIVHPKPQEREYLSEFHQGERFVIVLTEDFTEVSMLNACT